MNKRQKKKKRKKYLPVIVDESPLWLMTDEERKLAIAEHDRYVEKYAYRKKYKNLKGKYLTYHYPRGKTVGELTAKLVRQLRSTRIVPTVVVQNMSDFEITSQSEN